MVVDDVERTIQDEAQSVLLVGGSGTILERVTDYGRVIALAGEGYGETVLDGLVTLGDGTGVVVIEVGAEVRSASTTTNGSNVSDAAVVKGVPSVNVDRIEAGVDDALRERCATDSVALYVHGEGLLSTVGVGATYHLLERIERRQRTEGVMVRTSVPATAPDALVAGVASLFDEVLEIRGGEATLPGRGYETLSYEQRFDLLGPARRRSLLRVLDDDGGAVGIDALVERIAAHDRDDVDRLRTLVYQVDLPKLEEMGIVDFDADRGTVVLERRAIQLWPLLAATWDGL